jgi:hypothetical protein
MMDTCLVYKIAVLVGVACHGCYDNARIAQQLQH